MGLDFLTVFKHLLPKARAWNITTRKPLRYFFEGLAVLPGQVRDAVDAGWGDLFSATTRDLPAAESMWNLPSAPSLTTAQRRSRLLARRQEPGGQSPRYIEDTLQAAGFEVYVHEWFAVKAQVPPVPAVPRDPSVYLEDGLLSRRYWAECGEVLAECGEAEALCGNPKNRPGYLLVNKITRAERDVIPDCGEALAQCGEAAALCGNFDKYLWIRRIYSVPTDPSDFPFVLYIGGSVFGDLADVANARKDEFEDLVLRLCPAQQWLGILVNYN